jgi:type I restriction enzyme R subunit
MSQTDVDLADYALFVGKQAAGIIEAKKGALAYNITTVQEQTQGHAVANFK